MKSAVDILIVDDEASIVQLGQIVFKSEGFKVRVAFGGRQALRLIGQRVPDILLLDVMMPDIDGINVCRQVRTSWANQLKIIMYTADQRESTLERCLAAGADFVLTKEIPVSQLPLKLKTLSLNL